MTRRSDWTSASDSMILLLDSRGPGRNRRPVLGCVARMKEAGMRLNAWVGATVVLGATTSYADPPGPPRSPPAITRCAITTPAGTLVATFDLGTMSGTVTADGSVGTRRFAVKAAPHAATYMLIFEGYGPGDEKPAAESMKKGASVIARIVAYGDVNHLFLDSDYRPLPHAPMDGFVCK